MLEANVYITLKKTVADPQGLTIKHALESLGNDSIKEVRTGKLVNIKLDTADQDEAKKKVNEMCKTLLANPVIEDYRFDIIKL